MADAADLSGDRTRPALTPEVAGMGIAMALGAAAAILASVPTLAGLFLVPLVLLGGIALIRSIVLCLVLVLFFQQNDILLALADVPALNKVLAAVALIAVAVTLTRAELGATLRAGSLPLLCWFGLFLTFGATILVAEDAAIAFETTERLLSMGVLSLLFAFGIKSVRDVSLIIHVFLLSLILSASVTVFVYFDGEPLFSPELRGDDGVAMWDGTVRSTGMTLESVPMSATMLLGGVMLAFVYAVRGGRRKWLYGALAAFGVAAILLSFTRSATLTLGLAALFMLWRLKAHPRFRQVLGATLIGAVLVAAMTPASVWNKFTALGDTSNDLTVLRRASYQHIGAELVAENPFLGVGAGNYIVHYASDEYRFVPGRSEEPRPLHNVYLRIAAETGLIGYVFFVTLLASTARILFDLSRSMNGTIRLQAEALLFAFLAMGVQFVFLSSVSVLYFWVIIGLTIALRRIANEETERQPA